MKYILTTMVAIFLLTVVGCNEREVFYDPHSLVHNRYPGQKLFKIETEVEYYNIDSEDNEGNSFAGCSWLFLKVLSQDPPLFQDGEIKLLVSQVNKTIPKEKGTKLTLRLTESGEFWDIVK